MTLFSIWLQLKGTWAPLGSMGWSHWNLGVARSLHAWQHLLSAPLQAYSFHPLNLSGPSF